MNQILINTYKPFIYKKASEMNLSIVIVENEMKMFSAKASQYVKMLDVLKTAGLNPKTHTATRDQNGHIIDILTF